MKQAHKSDIHISLPASKSRDSWKFSGHMGGVIIMLGHKMIKSKLILKHHNYDIPSKIIHLWLSRAFEQFDSFSV